MLQDPPCSKPVAWAAKTFTCISGNPTSRTGGCGSGWPSMYTSRSARRGLEVSPSSSLLHGHLPHARGAAAAAAPPHTARARPVAAWGFFLAFSAPRGTYLTHGGLRQRPALNI